MATQMQLKVLFGRKTHIWPPGLLERKNNNKVVSFSALFFVFTLTWITEKELERVIESKYMEIQTGGEKMRNASGQQGENER